MAIRRASPRRSTGLLSLASALAFLAACGGGGDAPGVRPPGSTTPVLLLGVDGLEWNVLLPLLEAGRMPNVAGLIERGTHGTLATLMPTKSPRIWTTIATGKLPEQHGILGFTKPPASPGQPRLLFTGADRRVKAYWNILDDYGVSSDTIGWWMTFPAEHVSGLMVSQTNTTEGRILSKGSLVTDVPGQVWPPDAEAGVLATFAEADAGAERFAREVFGSLDASLSEDAEKRWSECLWSFRADSTYAAIARSRVAGGPRSRVTAVYVGGTDVVGHRFWSAYEPAPFGLDPASDEVRVFGDVIPSYYEYVDGFLGELLASFPPETTVILVSDHGMSAFVPEDDAPKTLRRLDHGTSGEHDADDPGVFIAAGRGIARDPRSGSRVPARSDLATLGGVADVCPTLLALLGIPYGADMEGRPMLSVLDAEFLEQHPIASVPTHDDADWLAGRGVVLEVREDERIEQLKNLGYLGDEGDER